MPTNTSAPVKNTNIESRLVTFTDKNIEQEQMYFNIHRILLIILIVLIIGISL